MDSKEMTFYLGENARKLVGQMADEEKERRAKAAVDRAADRATDSARLANG